MKSITLSLFIIILSGCSHLQTQRPNTPIEHFKSALQKDGAVLFLSHYGKENRTEGSSYYAFYPEGRGILTTYSVGLFSEEFSYKTDGNNIILTNFEKRQSQNASIFLNLGPNEILSYSLFDENKAYDLPKAVEDKLKDMYRRQKSYTQVADKALIERAIENAL